MFEYCKYKNIGIISYAALLAGALARPLDQQETQRSQSVAGTPFDKVRRESDNEIIRRVEKLAKEKSWTMTQVALAWSTTKVVSPIVGATSVSHLRWYFCFWLLMLLG
jgi:aryl-alcohol dehydrogenase-like predicted oxidoreductase